VEAVEELVLESGPDRVTLKRVSERPGVALATLYKHFESRMELLAGAYRTLAGEIDGVERVTVRSSWATTTLSRHRGVWALGPAPGINEYAER
jgi:AcrR family transcriptional regulator